MLHISLKISFIGIFIVLIVFVDCRKRCNYDLHLLWTREVAQAPFVSAPLIGDINADGKIDIIAVTFTEALTVVSAEDGHPLPNTQWPQQLFDTSTHSSPLTFDVNKDGYEEIILVTSDGRFLIFNHDGQPFTNFTFQLPGLQIDKDWFMKKVSLEKSDIHSFILDEPPQQGKARNGYVAVDPHVLATPSLADLNNDNIVEELVIPVSYYLDLQYYSKDENRKNLDIPITQLEKYLAGGLVVFNLTSLTVINTIHLELTEVDSEYPGYVLFSPTIIDVDGNGGPPEIVVGTSGGQIHVLSSDGISKTGFPIPKDAIHGQVTVADVNGDGKLEIIAMDTNANVMCFDASGQILWETQITGSSTAGARLADVDEDGVVDIIFATESGQIWVLEGVNGIPLKDWPIKTGRGHQPQPTLLAFQEDMPLHIVALGDDTHIHVTAGDASCRDAIALGETSYVSMLTYDLVSHSDGLELLVATKDGMLMCLGRKPTGTQHTHWRHAALNGFQAETKSPNGFLYPSSQVGVAIHRDSDNLLDLTGSWVDITFDLIDELSDGNTSQIYKINVYFGSKLLSSSTQHTPNTYTVTFEAPSQPVQGHLKVIVTNKYGQIYQDMVAVRFNLLFLHDLKWLLLSPFVAMAVILLLLYGYPAKDLLPMTTKSL